MVSVYLPLFLMKHEHKILFIMALHLILGLYKVMCDLCVAFCIQKLSVTLLNYLWKVLGDMCNMRSHAPSLISIVCTHVFLHFPALFYTWWWIHAIAFNSSSIYLQCYCTHAQACVYALTTCDDHNCLCQFSKDSFKETPQWASACCIDEASHLTAFVHKIDSSSHLPVQLADHAWYCQNTSYTVGNFT